MGKKERDEKLKELSDAIVKAMTQDDEVMAILEDLKDQKLIESGTLLGMAIKANELLEIADIALAKGKIEQSGNSQVVSQQPKALSEDFSSREIIDGRDLSEMESAFQEWVIERFDEKRWLKNSGLIW